jgi:glycosyltransferase involved in cell wall biosynthesis
LGGAVLELTLADPLISVCVPLFNKAAGVETSLQTVAACRDYRLEIVVFDNGSTDGSSDVVARLARADERIRHVRIEHTMMIQESWRMAMLHGRGEFLKVQSADDELDPEFFRAMLPPLLARPEIGFTLCAERAEARGLGADPAKVHNAYRDINDTCRRLLAIEDPAERARQLMKASALENRLGNIYKALFRRSALPLARWSMVTRAYPLPTAYPDWDFLVRLILKHRGVFVERELSRYLITPDAPMARLLTDGTLRVADAFQRLLQVMTVLGDPDLAPMRAACTPEDLQYLADQAGVRIEQLVNQALTLAPPRG